MDQENLKIITSKNPNYKQQVKKAIGKKKTEAKTPTTEIKELSCLQLTFFSNGGCSGHNMIYMIYTSFTHLHLHTMSNNIS